MIVPACGRYPLAPRLRRFKDAREARVLHAQIAQLRFHQALKPGGKRLTRLGQKRRLGAIGLELILVIHLGPPQPFIHALQPRQLVLHLLVLRGQIVCRHAVAALQAANQVQTLLHRLVALRIEILALQHIPKLDPYLLSLIERRGKAIRQSLIARVQLLNPAQSLHGVAQLVHGAGAPAAAHHCAVGGAHRAVDSLGAGKARPFSREAFRFPWPKLRCVKLAYAGFEIFLPLGTLLVFLAQRRETNAALAPQAIAFLHPSLLRLKISVSEGIQKRHMVFCLQQALVRMLSVHIHQQRRQPAQKGQRHDDPAYAAQVAFPRGDLPLDADQSAIGLQLLLSQHSRRLRAIRNVHQRLHGGTVAAGANQPAIGAFAQHQVDAVHDDGFACAGFAAEHLHAFLKFHLKLLDQRDVAHRHGHKHRAYLLSPVFAAQRRIMAFSRSMTGRTSSTARTIIKIVLSPAMVPSTSGHCRLSMVSAAMLALAGSVRTMIWL